MTRELDLDVPQESIVPAATLLATALPDENEPAIAVVVATLADDAGVGERLGGLWTLLMLLFTPTVGNAEPHSAPGADGVSMWLFDSSLPGRAVAGNPQRLTCAQVLTATAAGRRLAPRHHQHCPPHTSRVLEAWRICPATPPACSAPGCNEHHFVARDGFVACLNDFTSVGAFLDRPLCPTGNRAQNSIR